MVLILETKYTDPMQHTWATCHMDQKCNRYSIFKSLSWKAEKNDNMAAAFYGQQDMIRRDIVF